MHLSSTAAIKLTRILLDTHMNIIRQLNICLSDTYILAALYVIGDKSTYHIFHLYVQVLYSLHMGILTKHL